MNPEAQQALFSGLGELGLSDYESVFCSYIDLLKHWNHAYNLVAKTDDSTLISRHILDSLAARPFMKAGPCLDVGSGAGLPGLILAVTMPGTEWVLLDANGKKTRFCVQAVRELGLSNVRVVQQRIESYQPEKCYMTIISRAYSLAADFVSASKRLMCPGGQILAMKGRVAEAEKVGAEATGLQLEIKSMHVPGQKGERHMMIFKN